MFHYENSAMEIASYIMRERPRMCPDRICTVKYRCCILRITMKRRVEGECHDENYQELNLDDHIRRFYNNGTFVCKYGGKRLRPETVMCSSVLFPRNSPFWRIAVKCVSRNAKLPRGCRIQVVSWSEKCQIRRENFTKNVELGSDRFFVIAVNNLCQLFAVNRPMLHHKGIEINFQYNEQFENHRNSSEIVGTSRSVFFELEYPSFSFGLKSETHLDPWVPDAGRTDGGGRKVPSLSVSRSWPKMDNSWQIRLRVSET